MFFYQKCALVILLGVLSVIYILCLVLMVKRRDYQPLKSRSVSLIFFSTFGNFCYFLCLMMNKILTNNYWHFWDDLKHKPENSQVTEVLAASTRMLGSGDLPPMPHYSTETDAAIKMSCFFSMAQWWLFRGMWFIPYLFRAFRL